MFHQAAPPSSLITGELSDVECMRDEDFDLVIIVVTHVTKTSHFADQGLPLLRRFLFTASLKRDVCSKYQHELEDSSPSVYSKLLEC